MGVSPGGGEDERNPSALDSRAPIGLKRVMPISSRLGIVLIGPLPFIGLAAGCKQDERELATAKRPPEQTPAAAVDLSAQPPLRDPDLPGPAELTRKIAQFAPVELTAPVADLPESERKALDAIIDAAELLDPIFDRQAWLRSAMTRRALQQNDDALSDLRLRYFEIMRGPWDRQDDHAPFVYDIEHPPGAGYYPEDLTASEFRAYVKAHPEQKEALESLFTMVKRKGDELVAIPYSDYFERWLEPAAAKLEEAAAYTRNESLSRFLQSRAEAFRTDDYYQSDKDWMDLDSRVEVTIGPYETYEDKLLGLKAAFEAFVTVSDPEASARLAKYKSLLPAMEKNLPVPDDVKTKRGAESPIRVVDLVFSSGDARKSVQTIAFNLPNDERVRKEKGAKKVLLRNSIEKKFDEILKPIGAEILAEKHVDDLNAKAFFNQVLFHELSHSLGPAFTTVDGEKKEVRLALGASYSPLEECKADVMGAYNVLYMIERGELPKDFKEPFLTSYFAGLFRSVRFGVAEAHGKGAAVQINRYLEEGAAELNRETGRFEIDLAQLEKSIEKLTRDLVMLQHRGDEAAVDALLAKYGVVSPPMKTVLSRLGSVPVDIRPIYPLAGETRS
jgi:hypothetical protein